MSKRTNKRRSRIMWISSKKRVDLSMMAEMAEMAVTAEVERG